MEHMTVWARTKGVCELQANRISDLIKFQHAVDQDTQDVMNAVSPVVRRYFQSRALMSVLLQNDTFVSLSESLLRDLCQEMRLTAAVKGTVLSQPHASRICCVRMMMIGMRLYWN